MKNVLYVTIFIVFVSVIRLSDGKNDPHGCPQHMDECMEYCLDEGYRSAKCNNRECICEKKDQSKTVDEDDGEDSDEKNIAPAVTSPPRQSIQTTTSKPPTIQPKNERSAVESYGCPGDIYQCLKHCKSQAYTSARCSGQECSCHKESETSSPSPNSNTDGEYGCPGNIRSCMQHCKSEGYHIAKCRNKTCSCENKKVKKE